VSTTIPDSPEVGAYLAAVRQELGDLRPEERDDLLAEVEASLLEAAEESDAPIAARLGPPADFAAELRAAAGLAGAAGQTRAPRLRRLEEAWRGTRAAALKRVLGELAPLWWIARAYVAVALFAWAINADWSAAVPFVPLIWLGGPASPSTGVLLLVAAGVLSVAYGLWEHHRGRRSSLGVSLNVALAVAALPLAVDLIDRFSDRPFSTTPYVVAEAPQGLVFNGAPVENIYPFSRDGRLLRDVLLYDQTGTPLDLRPNDADPSRRVLEAADGTQRFNAFPIRYFEPGSGIVAKPGAAPPISWSRIVTPPLKPKPER
jgi:hypothetical protein